MKVRVRQFDVNMEVKSKGIEFEVRKPDDSEQIGDCYLTMTGLIWCKGKTGRNSGVKISWDEFMDIMESADTKTSAVKAARKSG